MNLFPRTVLWATPLAVALTLAMTVGAAAQVASLVSPDETPVPDADSSEALLEYADRDEALLAFAQCMRDNGIEMDDPTFSDGGRGRVLGLGRGGGQRPIDQYGDAFTVAREACDDILAAAAPEIDPEAEQERLEDQLLLSQCIRDNGYPEYPDPVIGADGRLQRNGGGDLQAIGIDRRSEEFRQLIDSCRDDLGLEDFGPGGGFGRGAN